MQRHSVNSTHIPCVSVCVKTPTSTENNVQEEVECTILYDPGETQLNPYIQTSEQDLLNFQYD